MSWDTAPSPAAAVSKRATTARLRSPVRVAVIDIAEPLCDLDCTRPLEPPYTGAWILVCNSGYPLGSIEIPLAGTLITAAELKHELRHQLSETWSPVRPGTAFPLPKISVVVPSNFARPDQLRRCVERLIELDYPDYEVIVVDNRPGNVPPANIPEVRVVREPHPGISAARNRGIEVATGEIIAFTDDDVVADRRWLRALAERFAREPDLSVVTGLVVPLELETTAQVLFHQSSRGGIDRGFDPLTFERVGRFRVLRRALRDGTEQVGSLYETGEFGFGLNMAFRAAVLREKGGFDVALGTGTPARAGEDLAMLVELLAAGHQVAYEPGAIVQHSLRATLAELEHQIHGYRIGFTAMLTAITLRDPRHLIGLAAVLPTWLRSLRGPSSAKQLDRPEEYSSLARAELRGMLAGPLAYLRSYWVHRVKRRRPR